MAYTPPEDFIQWATNDASEKTDPGSPLTADGWAVGDAPAPSHWNYLMHAIAGYSSFSPKALPGLHAFANISFQGAVGTQATNPFHASDTPLVLTVQFINGRWYAVRKRAAGNVDLYDSVDGDTWTALNNATGGVVNTDRITRFVLGQGLIAIGLNDQIFVSTDNTIAQVDFAADWDASGFLSRVHEIAYSAYSDRWLVAGLDDTGTDGEIFAYDSPASTPSSVATNSANAFLTIALDPTGQYGVAGTDNARTYRTSDGGLTWFLNGTTAADPIQSTWSEQLQAFVLKLADNSVRYIEKGAPSLTDISVPTTAAYITPEFEWFIDPTTEELTMITGEAPGAAANDVYAYNEQKVGFANFGPTLNWEDSVIEGSPGKLIFPYGTNGQKAVLIYGDTQSG